jgi:putative salt-induced outer membrane protein YdiY
MKPTLALAMAACALAACLIPPPASADEIVLTDGGRLTGTVKDLAGDVVTLTSDYAEPIKVKKDHVRGIATDQPVEVRLTSGEVLKGRLATGADGRIVVDRGEGEAVTGIELKSVAAINPPPVGKWHGSASLSGNLQSGNTDRSGLSVGADAQRRGERDRFSMRFLYNIAQENGSMTTRNAFGALQYDYFFTKRSYGYLGVELLNDTFKDLNLRTVVGPGAGYQVWETPARALSLEAGLAYFSEDLRSQEDKSWMTLRLAGTFRAKLFDRLEFTDKVVLYPSLKSFSDFTLRNEAALLTAIGSGWAMKLADILDYVNNPPAGTTSTDSIFTAGLQYAF